MLYYIAVGPHYSDVITIHANDEDALNFELCCVDWATNKPNSGNQKVDHNGCVTKHGHRRSVLARKRRRKLQRISHVVDITVNF